MKKRKKAQQSQAPQTTMLVAQLPTSNSQTATSSFLDLIRLLVALILMLSVVAFLAQLFPNGLIQI